MRRKIFIIGLVFSLFPLAAWADFEKKIIYPYERFRDVRKPRTRGEILWANQWQVNTQDGVNKQEACLIAQKELILRDKKCYDDHCDYDLTKPKVIGETNEEWQVRLPAKSSFTKKNSADFLICVNKKTGKVTCFKGNS